ncbi:hypothetical protein BH20ACT5_BH20ACT5_12090 [soil metagenome]
MHERYVTDPAGMRWVVGRKWLFGRPRYRGFRFGRKSEVFFESAIVSAPPEATRTVRRSKPAPAAGGDRAWVRDRGGVYLDLDDEPWTTGSGYRRRRRRAGGGPVILPVPGWGGGGGWGGSDGGSSGSVSRGSSGSVDLGSSGSSERGGGGAGGAMGALGGLGVLLVQALKWLLLVAAVAAVVAFTIFVGLPAIFFGIELLIAGIYIGWRELTGRPWVVEARQHRPAPEVLAWEVVGWKRSGRVIDTIAEAIRAGTPPTPQDAEQVLVQTPAPA